MRWKTSGLIFGWRRDDWLPEVLMDFLHCHLPAVANRIGHSLTQPLLTRLHMTIRAFWLSFIVCLTGCAAPTLSLEGAKAYAGFDVRQFVATRFTDKQSVSRGDLTYYTAYFNEVNNRQLFRPIEEITNLCKAQDGELTRTTQYLDNPVAKSFPNPTAEAFSAFAEARYAYQKNPTQLNRDMLLTAGGTAFSRAEYFNTAYDSKGAMKGYEAAARTEAYGTFQCLNKLDRIKRWAVAISPLGFVKKQANEGLSTHELVIEIRPL